MASAREYLDGIVEYITKIRAMEPTDAELEESWIRDDLAGAENRLYAVVEHLEEERGVDPDTFDPEKGTYASA